MNTSATKPITAPDMSGTADVGSETTQTMPELNRIADWACGTTIQTTNSERHVILEWEWDTVTTYIKNHYTTGKYQLWNVCTVVGFKFNLIK